MIARISGKLIDVTDDAVLIQTNSITYKLSIPACDFPNIQHKIGNQIEFFTLYYLEGQGQGSNYRPRLIGFQSQEDLDFFECFTKVKGVGPKKALRAMTAPTSQIALAISEGNISFLVSLPEIGKRTAETIVAELNGKIDGFISLKSDAPNNIYVESPTLNDAIAMLMQLGESDIESRRLVNLALVRNPDPKSAEDLVKEALASR